jgi:hypothetical protein
MAKGRCGGLSVLIHLPIAGLLAAVPGAVIRIVLVAMSRLECRVAV